MPNNNRGFTLIELLVVIAIIGILASTVLTSLNSARKSARDAGRLQEVKQLQTSLELFRNTHGGSYPCFSGNVTDTTGCATQVQITPNSSGTHSAFRTAINWTFRADAARMRYRLRSTSSPTPNNDNPDRTSYTIILQLESSRRNAAGQTIAANGWCEINVGAGHAAYNYPSCF